MDDSPGHGEGVNDVERDQLISMIDEAVAGTRTRQAVAEWALAVLLREEDLSPEYDDALSFLAMWDAVHGPGSPPRYLFVPEQLLELRAELLEGG